MKFHVGDKVVWTSQGGGFFKTKSGAVAGVIPSGAIPMNLGYLIGEPESRRYHESYVVSVGGKHYWPLVKNLMPATIDKHIKTGEENMAELESQDEWIANRMRSLMLYICNAKKGDNITHVVEELDYLIDDHTLDILIEEE